MKTPNKSRLTTLLVGIWSCCVATSVVGFAWYDVRPAQSFTATPPVLPSRTQITAHALPQRPVVAMFVHPRCPCSRASLAEFSTIVQELRHDADFRVIFFKPASQSLAWVKRDNLFATASTMQNVTVSIDDDGKEAERFHAETSGFVVAYDTHGRLLFSGGITGSRGHEGNNAGEELLRKALYQAQQRGDTAAQPAYSPVFGCAILTNAANTAPLQQ